MRTRAFIVFLWFFLITHCVGTMRSSHELRETPAYSGFNVINPLKNYFFLAGDTQGTSHWEFWRENNDKENKLLIEEIVRREPAFVIHLGDLTTRGSSEKHWEAFDDLHTEWREKRIPYFPVLGNHEVYGSDKAALKFYFARFPHLEQRRWYSFAWKNVGFIMVDANVNTLSSAQKERQAQWYQDELERFERDQSIDHIIVCCHKPPFTNSQIVTPNRQSRKYFAEPFVRFKKTRIFFSGHAHTYERFQYGGKTFIVSGGGGAPRQSVLIDPIKRPYDDLFPGPRLRFFHFCRIEVRKRALLFSVLRLEPDQTFTSVDPLVIPE